MANYVPFARSNYFEVKEPQAFEAFCGKWRLTMIRGGEDEGEIPLYGFLCEDEAGLPSGYHDSSKDEYVEADILDELSTHLADGWVAIVREIGYEKLRYLVGYAVAVNAAGTRLDVNLDGIYELAKQLGSHITECEW